MQQPDVTRVEVVHGAISNARKISKVSNVVIVALARVVNTTEEACPRSDQVLSVASPAEAHRAINLRQSPRFGAQHLFYNA